MHCPGYWRPPLEGDRDTTSGSRAVSGAGAGPAFMVVRPSPRQGSGSHQDEADFLDKESPLPR